MPSSTSSPAVRVVIRLPYNRPKEGYDNPPRIEWNPEKENILWEVIARSRATENGVTDFGLSMNQGQGLAAHLAVPLPYLLFRAQTRYEEDLKGIQHLQGPFAPAPLSARPTEEDGKGPDRPDLARKWSARASESMKSGRLNTPLGIRARLNSLGYDSASKQSRASSSSVLTLQGVRNIPSPINTSISSPVPSDSNSEDEDEDQKAEEEARRLEEQEALDKKLKHLESTMTSNALGLVRDSHPKSKGKEPQRGRDLRSPTSPSPLRETYTSTPRRDLSSSDFTNTSSPQGSIPSIPSPPPESMQSPVTRHFAHTKSSSPPALSSRQATGHSHMPYRPLAVGMAHNSDRSSTHGSSASSFSDISESTSLSASALESALLSNIRGTGSRLSAFARSQFGRRTSRGMGNASMD